MKMIHLKKKKKKKEKKKKKKKISHAFPHVHFFALKTEAEGYGRSYNPDR
jgi:hypothetical protein